MPRTVYARPAAPRPPAHQAHWHIRGAAGGRRCWARQRRVISENLTEKLAKLPMPDHSGDVGWWHPGRRTLAGRRSCCSCSSPERRSTWPARKRFCIPAQNEVVPHVHVHGRYGQRLTERLHKAEARPALPARAGLRRLMQGSQKAVLVCPTAAGRVQPPGVHKRSRTSRRCPAGWPLATRRRPWGVEISPEECV